MVNFQAEIACIRILSGRDVREQFSVPFLAMNPETLLH
jgi:hypothetical protein